ncbi:MAG: hypothetical protein ACUVQY_09660 [Thermoproteota archaeon]
MEWRKEFILGVRDLTEGLVSTQEEKWTTPQSGFTRWSFIAMVYTAIIMQPATLYASLVSGEATSAGIVMGAQFMTVLLFTELARIYDKPLSKQEVLVIYVMGTSMAAETFWLDFLFKAYLRTSPIIKGFNMITPWFISPQPESMGLLMRDLLHVDWLPIFSIFLTVNLLIRFADLSLGLLAAQVYVEAEQLPFPLAQVEAQAVVTLAERDPLRMKVFTLSALIGAFYGFIVYGVSTLSISLTGVKLTLIPIPWLDMNPFLEKILPGGSFGFSTSLITFGLGMIIPGSVAIAQAVSAILIYLFGNTFLQRTSIFHEWIPGMDIALCWQRSILDFWASPIIGVSAAAATTPIILNRHYFAQAIRTLVYLPSSSKRAGYLPLWLILAMYASSTLGIIGITLWLVPDFAPYLPILIVISPVWAFLATMISARSVGLSGIPLNVPLVREATLIALPYSNTDIWFAPLYMGGGGVSWVQKVALARRTETSLLSVFKAYFIGLPIQMILGLIYLAAFWKIAPMPSTFYPATAISWPAQAIQLGLWATKQITILNPQLLTGSFAAGVVASFMLERFKIPFSFIGFALGMSQPIPYSVSIFMGAMLGKKLLIKVFGKEWFEKNKGVVVAGLALGEGLPAGLSAIVALVAKSLWIMPY